MTIMQLITASILDLVVSDEQTEAILALSLDSKTSSPNYLKDSFWDGISLVKQQDYLPIHPI